MDSVLRPRDIQTRIRSGESPETVAAAAKTTVDKIMGFAAPVLAERAYVAQQAQKASVRRRLSAGAPGQLGAAVAEVLAGTEVDPESVEWDAWRRDDGRWTLVAEYQSGVEVERAEFVYDTAGRFVTAEDDQSRWLVGERSSTRAEPEQMPLGEDTIEMVTGRRPSRLSPVEELFPSTPRQPRSREEPDAEDEPAPEPAAAQIPEPEPQPEPEPEPVSASAALREPTTDEITVDLTDPVVAVRGGRAVSSADADWMATQATDRPRSAPASAPETLFEVEVDTPETDTASARDADSAVEPARATDAGVEATGADATSDEDTESAEPPPPPARSGKSRGRAAIPSWDEIMFGSTRGD